MTAPSESQGGSPADPENVAVRKRRPGARRRRSGWLLLAVGVLWLLGNGMGWFASAPRGEQGADGEGGQGGRSGQHAEASSPTSAKGDLDPADVAKLALVLTPAAVSPQAGPKQPQEVPQEVAPSAESSPSPSPPTAPPPSPAAGMAKDRFDSLVSLLELHIEERELGRASGVIQRLQAQSLGPAQRASLERMGATLRSLRDAAERRVLAEVRKGDVLAADQQAAQLVVGDRWFAPILTAAAKRAAPRAAASSGSAEVAGDDWQRAVVAEVQTGGPASPLARNRQVLVRWRNELRPAVVANGRLDQVTVRLRTGQGQSYPTVPAIDCEPTQSTAPEAIEMGFAAVRAKAPRLARLWLLRASLLQAELSDRGQQLLRLLR